MVEAASSGGWLWWVGDRREVADTIFHGHLNVLSVVAVLKDRITGGYNGDRVGFLVGDR